MSELTAGQFTKAQPLLGSLARFRASLATVRFACPWRFCQQYPRLSSRFGNQEQSRPNLKQGSGKKNAYDHKVWGGPPASRGMPSGFEKKDCQAVCGACVAKKNWLTQSYPTCKPCFGTSGNLLLPGSPAFLPNPKWTKFVAEMRCEEKNRSLENWQRAEAIRWAGKHISSTSISVLDW